MHQCSEVFVGLDASKMKISVALAEEGRQGEIRFLGDIGNTPDAVRRLVTKLSGKYHKLLFCYEAGPTGYGLYRQITDLGHDCTVIAPSLIPKRPGEHVKTNRRDAVSLARLHRAGELTAIWVPDQDHEAIRDLVRARDAAMEDLREKCQHLQSFLCAMDGSIPASGLGLKCMRAGCRTLPSRIQPSILFSVNTARRSKMPRRDLSA
jgi:transposase